MQQTCNMLNDKDKKADNPPGGGAKAKMQMDGTRIRIRNWNKENKEEQLKR